MKYQPKFGFDNQVVIDALNEFLSDTYLIYIKAQNYHWNVTGPQFQALHVMFQDQYENLRDAADLIAERVRAMGGVAAGSCSQFNQLSKIKETTQHLAWQEMVLDALQDNADLAINGRGFANKLEALGDKATAHLILDRVNYHEKTAWMLRSILQ
jgi:starvation-inducible DNA-binding protein